MSDIIWDVQCLKAYTEEVNKQRKKAQDAAKRAAELQGNAGR